MVLTQEEVIGGIVGGIAASLVSIAMLALLLPEALTLQAELYGLEGSIAGGGVHLGHSIVVGLLYALMMNVATDWYLTKLLKLTRRSPNCARGIKPLMDRFGIAVVISALTGIQFGLVLWLVPTLAVTVGGVGGGDASAFASVWFLVSMLVFGLVLGSVYGEYIAH